MHTQRLLAGTLCGAFVFGASASVWADEPPQGLTRAQARDILLAAASDYHPGLTAEDILKGDETGDLHLDRIVSRAEALVMLERAFDGLPEPVGANQRSAFPAETFTDVPLWAESELASVFAAGIVAGTGEGSMSPMQPVTEEALNTFIRRVYALKGSNLKDDFYATVNKEWLDQATIPAGQMINGSMYGVSYEVNEQVAGLIASIATQPQEVGTPEAKIAALYHTVTDIESREKAGATPIRGYLDEIEAARTLDELMEATCHIQTELGIATLLGYGLSVDLVDSNHYTVTLEAFSPGMDKDFYTNATQGQKDLYLNYRAKLLTLAGEDEETAAEKAQKVYELEVPIAAASLDRQDQGNVDLIYNIYTPEEIASLFPNVDMNRLYELSTLEPTDRIGIGDVGALEATASLFTEANLDGLKAEAQLGLISSVSACLNLAFTDAAMDFQAAYYGVEGRLTTEQIAAQQVQSLLDSYLGRVYAETYFTPEAKADVENMIQEFLDIYAERIQNLDWMSEQTKAKALQKLKSIGVKVGYPDSWETYLDDVEIKAPEEGGTFLSNVIALQKASMAEMYSYQNKPVDKDKWSCAPYVVNAFYNATNNDITFPAAILQAPMYDVNASRAKNLGGIGYVIAHEITHAFDNDGCKFDENGNAATSEENPYGWWTEADYAAFQSKCEEVVAWYDGQEAVPGITCNGKLTLSENVADLGAAQCIVEAASREETPDYETLFRAMAETWASTCSRETQEYFSVIDVHAPDKLRANRVLQTIPLFYETFGIQEGDGMWTAPESRVSIW